MKFIVNVDLEGVACAYGAFDGSVESTFNIICQKAGDERSGCFRKSFV